MEKRKRYFITSAVIGEKWLGMELTAFMNYMIQITNMFHHMDHVSLTVIVMHGAVHQLILLENILYN